MIPRIRVLKDIEENSLEYRIEKIIQSAKVASIESISVEYVTAINQDVAGYFIAKIFYYEYEPKIWYEEFER